MAKEIGPLSLTIEHIFPKNPGAEWAEVVKNDPTIAEECTHRLGNLCLLAEIDRDLGKMDSRRKEKCMGTARLVTTKSWGHMRIGIECPLNVAKRRCRGALWACGGFNDRGAPGRSRYPQGSRRRAAVRLGLEAGTELSPSLFRSVVQTITYTWRDEGRSVRSRVPMR
jgi:hypothetical protein